jgi:hypothetical protein
MTHQLSFKISYDYDSHAVDINIPFTLRSGAESWEGMAKLDPGSTFCIFQRLIGERLGFDIERGLPQWVGTATGRFLTYGHEATLNVLGIETIPTVYFADDKHFPVNVLGRVGWLDRMRLGLVDYDNRLYLSDYNDPAE